MRRLSVLSSVVCFLMLIANASGNAAEKVVDTILLPHSELPEGVFRWSEGSILNLDGKQELMLLVSAFGHGGHDDSTATIIEFRSHDGGRTWTPLADARVFQENIGKRNVMAPSLLRLDNGDILCFFLVINDGSSDGGPWVRRSTDNGQTWSEPVKLPFSGYGGPANDRAIQLKNGRIVLPCWQTTDQLGSCYSYCLYSDDHGQTWKKTDLISTPKGSTGRSSDPAAEEPAVIELEDGRLLMFMRTYLKSIYRSYSVDHGATWGPAESTGIPSPGSEVTLARLSTGDLLLIYNWAKPETIDGPWPRNFLTAAISKDEGRTFSFVRHLDGGTDFPGKITMANVEMVGDNVVVMYSKSESKKNTYDWRLQVLPVAWFYEGDQQQVLGAVAASPPTPVVSRKVDRTHQLFLDESLLESVEGLDRVVNQPEKHVGNPVLTYTEPWEGNCVITWGSVLYDQERELFQIWYEVFKKIPPEGDHITLLCYATSRDGLKWDKPQLNLVSCRGSKANNIVFPPDDEIVDSATVFLNPKPGAGDKYLLYFYSERHKGICRAISPDGTHWTREPGVVVAAGDRSTAGYDSQRERFYVITRIPGRGLRSCGLWESPDGRQFEFVREIAVADDKDPAATEFYGLIRFPYAGMRLGFLEPYFVPRRKLNTQLMFSRDGVDWHRVADRQTFLDWGPPGSWDRTWVTPSHNPPIERGDKLLIYYQGRETLHNSEAPYGHIGSVGLATLRIDGFVSLDAQNREGKVTTTPLVLTGSTLHINAFAKPGHITAEVLGADGAPLAGFSRADCLPLVNKDSLNHTIAWRDGRSLTELADRQIKLRFYVQGAKLYSFWTE